ncbi:MAG: metalloregulator ArsR/SmtB family transcription factor [Candidatus Bathyarchaeota archaeon]|nr:metalloregulator ArsR/SmtB family transcription factor [Candidatus Bathyarchaeota archaeon]
MSVDTFIIKDPEVAKLLADPTRRQILHILRHREQSVTDLAKALERNHSSVIHHLNVLREAGLIKVTREEKVRNMVQPYYRSVSRRYHVAYSLTEALSEDPDFSAWQEDYIDRLLKGLEAYSVIVPKDREDEVRNLLRTCYLREKKAFEDRLSQRKTPVQRKSYGARNVASILSHMQLRKDPEYVEASQRLSDIIDEIKGEHRVQ